MNADDLRALSAAATPGPWRNGFPRVIAATGGEAHNLMFSVLRAPDAELIVWLRNHADALAGLIDALEHIADGRMCTVVVDNAPPSSWCRNVSSRSRDSRYGATRWCDACIARDAIAALEADR